MQQLCELQHIVLRADGTGAEHDHGLARCQNHLCCALDSVWVGRGRRRGPRNNIEIHQRLHTQRIPGAFECNGTRTARGHLLECASDEPRHLRRMIDALRPFGETAQRRELIREFMQNAMALADFMRRDFTRDTQHRRVAGVGRAQRARSVEHAWSGHAGVHAHLARGFRVAIGHVRGTLLVAAADVRNCVAAFMQRIEQLVDMHAGNAKDLPHAVANESFDNSLAGAANFLHG